MRKPTAQPQRRTMGGPASSSGAASRPRTAGATTGAGGAAPRTTTTSASPKPRMTTSASATTATRKPATTSASGTRTAPTATRSTGRTTSGAAATATRKPSAKRTGPASPSGGKTPLGSLYGPSPARSRLEQLAALDDSNSNNGSKNNNSSSRPRDSSIGRHADLDDMSPENASFQELVELREKQFYRVKDVLIRYNEDLQKRLDTASAIGSIPRHDPTIAPTSQTEQSASPPTRTRGMTVGPVSTADEAKIIEELLNEEKEDEEQQQQTNAVGTAEEKKEGENTAEDENAAVGEGSETRSAKGPDTPRVGGGVSRTALRAIVKHAQDTVNKAIDEDRERQADFEESVLGRMSNLERILGALQNAIREQHEARANAEAQDKTVRNSEVEPLREKVSEIEQQNAQKAMDDKEKMEVVQGQIDFVASDLQALAKDIKDHQQNLEERTKEAAEEATRKAIDDADDRVRDLCDAVERGLALTERCRDDIPQAIITSVENVEASLHRAMQSEFEAQNLRIQVAEENQAEINKKNKEMLEQEVAGMKEQIGETLGDLRRQYGEALQEQIEEVRKKAEEYEEARRLALPVPDADRVKLMQEELESTLQMLKYLTEANSGAMASTIPPRLERSEQKTAELEATLESQQQEIDRLRHSNLNCHVAVGPDNLKDAWLGVSSYRAPPPGMNEGEEGENNNNQEGGIIGFDENGQPIEAYSPENMHQVHNQISEALKMIARRHSSMSPLRGSPRSTFSTSNNESFGAGAGAAAGASTSSPSSNNNSRRGQNQNQSQSQQHQQPFLFSSGSADTLPKDFDTLSPREQLEAINQVSSAKRAQLLTVQKVLSNIQNAFHELTLQEADIMAHASPSRLAPSGGTPRTVSEYQSNRKICDEIAARKQRMYEKERMIVEKRNKLSREIENLQDRESEVFKALSLSSRSN